MFNLAITEETNGLLKKVRKGLRAKGYKSRITKTDRYLGEYHIKETTETFIKDNLIFEIERDWNEGIITARVWIFKRDKSLEDTKEIGLASILDLA